MVNEDQEYSSVTIGSAIDRLKSGAQTHRAQGLRGEKMIRQMDDQDLKHVLSLHRFDSAFLTEAREKIKDKGFHQIFEALFRFVQVEKPSYARASKSAKTSSAIRLSECAAVLRLTVEISVQRIRPKTVKALVDHVIETLASGKDEWCEPLIADYVKCLRAIFHYRPHVEHFSRKEWQSSIDFCIQDLLTSGDGESSPHSSFSSHLRSHYSTIDAGSGRSTPIRISQKSGARSAGRQIASTAEDLVDCINYLTLASNAPILSRADSLLTSLISSIQSNAIPSNAYYAAFAALNTVLGKAGTDRLDLIRTFKYDVLNVIRQAWSSKPSLSKATLSKDEMLITFMIIKPSLTTQCDRTSSADDVASIESLFELLQYEYCKSREDDLLQIDDLILGDQDAEPAMGISGMGPRYGSSRGETSWALLSTLSTLSVLLDRYADCRRNSGELDEGPQKRPRPTKHIEDFLQRASGSKGSDKIFALQIMPFLLSEGAMLIEIFEDLFDRSSMLMQNDNAKVASWTMIALARQVSNLAYHLVERSIRRRFDWTTIFQAASRLAASIHASRAACYLMGTILRLGLLQYPEVAGMIDSMTSIANVQGPSVLTDTGLSLWKIILSMQSQSNPIGAQGTSIHVIQWLRANWSLVGVVDRAQTAHMALFARPIPLLNVLSTCSGRSLPYTDSFSTSVPGPIVRAWYSHSRKSGLLDYLYLRDAKTTNESMKTASLNASQFETLSEGRTDHTILEMLYSKLEAFRHAWASLAEKESNLSLDVVQIVASLCVVVSVFAHAVQKSQSPRIREMLLQNDSLWADLWAFVRTRNLTPSDEQFPIVCLEAMFPLAPFLGGLTDGQETIRRGLSRLAPPAIESLLYLRDLERNPDAAQQDVMAFEEPVTSDKGRRRASLLLEDIPPDDLPAPFNVRCVRLALTVQLHTLYPEFITDNHADVSHVTEIISYITSLDADEFLASRDVIINFLTQTEHISRSEALMVLQKLGTTCLQRYELERSEVSLCLCLRVMEGLVECWTCEERDELGDDAADLYGWFIDVVKTKGIASSRVLITFASVLQKVIQLNSTYMVDPASLSARTILFQILHDGECDVKFEIAQIIPSIFDHFVLSEHDAIFDDVMDSLPSDPGSIEGIGLRLFVLARLASKWHTLLRQSVYHLFETPAHVPKSTPYAKLCLEHVAKAKALDSARSLFKLFMSQILYTWFESQSLEALPFRILDYTSLKDMILDVQDEVVGQLVMRAQDGQAAELSNLLGIEFDRLLEESFYKVEAYSIARDISIPPSQGNQTKGSEHTVRKAFEPARFRELVQSNFPRIIATLFRTLDQETQMDKAFAKRFDFQYAAENLQNMLTRSSSKTVLPASQQPTFRAKYFLDELEFLCKRAKFSQIDLKSMWTPPLFVFVIRELVESVHPALGPLAACATLRKVRLLVALAGDIALEGYPLEMTLSALSPFLVDFYCAEDAVGLFQYLLETGRQYLQRTPSFVAGIATSVLTSLRFFLSSSQESTTQESHFRATMTKAQALHMWLSKFLETYSSQCSDLESETAFRKLVTSAQNIRLGGTSTKETYESELIRQLLDDQRSGRKLLTPVASDAVLGLLCKEFQRPENFKDDVFGDDSGAAEFALPIWHTLHRREYGRDYRLWAVRTIGRAFATTGSVPEELLREHDMKLSASNYEHGGTDPPYEFESNTAIIEVLRSLLLDEKRTEAGKAERCLQSICTGLSMVGEIPWYEDSIPRALLDSLVWTTYPCPPLSLQRSEAMELQQSYSWTPTLQVAQWARQLATSLVLAVPNDLIMTSLLAILINVPDLGPRLLPYILHIVLLKELDSHQIVRKSVSEVFNEAFLSRSEAPVPHLKLILSTILYLRTQRKPGEATMAARDSWLDVNYEQAAAAAAKSDMHKTALLFLEMRPSQRPRLSRRSSVARYDQPSHLLQEIFSSIDDPDFFYGMPEDASIEAVTARLNYEQGGFKNISFQTARFDSDLRIPGHTHVSGNRFSIVRALNAANLHGLAQNMLSGHEGHETSRETVDDVLETALNLHQWDLPPPNSQLSTTANLYRAFQSMNTVDNIPILSRILDECFLSVLDQSITNIVHGQSLYNVLSTLAILTELDETLSSRSSADLVEEWHKMQIRSQWMETEEFNKVAHMIEGREIAFSTIVNRDYLRKAMNTTVREARLLEVNVFREILKASSRHRALQKALNTATYLSRLTESCDQVGLNIRGAVQFDLAQVLWEQGEMAASIRILKQVEAMPDLHKQAVSVGRPELLATLGHHIAEARLEKPEAIISDYLLAAIKALNDGADGDEAGRVFHEFASFCDHQLQNPDDLEDFRRIEKLRNRKLNEVHDLEGMIKQVEGKQRDLLKMHRTKTKTWFDLDDQEYQRLFKIREGFLHQSLENYLLSLAACDTYDNDVLRFCALWLDKSESDTANNAVSKHIPKVASRKFAPLMNQLSSRLLDSSQQFQTLLNALVLRICTDHPYHGMYQIFASSKSKGGRDDAAISRHTAATKMADKFRQNNRIGQTWVTIHNTNISFVRFANDRLEDSNFKSGAKIPLKKVPSAQKVVQEVTGSNNKIPPPTMKIPLRPDCNYAHVPRIVEFEPTFTIASGVSAPKIVTVRGSDGERYKQLFKGGNDDLRQDSIMEQVFEQVSNLLHDHRSTRRRNLGIRTYKVVPLTANAGIIEFVQNTIPLHDYLMPAHQKHFPKDLKANVCRKQIADSQARSVEERIRVFRHVTERFHPVMRYFFMEKFLNPDDWFSKRLAYTRSTAAISILGHVLGLGDRHGHNILLDEKTGEVIHIDLGVAFEQGRVLPVPEVVPFRLTRDLVDGMGITKTEGVFRRCCEFTLEALRQDSYSIMTILDVLRYDPLYSWSVSPLRMKRMQESQDAAAAAAAAATEPGGKANVNEPSEADRALTVVAKKLGKSLSVTATVNELIQQATDERNLAVLYCGWAAYA